MSSMASRGLGHRRGDGLDADRTTAEGQRDGIEVPEVERVEADRVDVQTV